MGSEETGLALDLEALSSTKFDAIQWVNGLFSSTDIPDGVDLIPSALNELTGAMSEVHTELDGAFRAAISVVPWAVREVETVRQKATSLRAGVDGVGERVAGVEGGAADAVASIAQADAIVRRVESARDLLRRVDDTTRLSDRLEGLFERGDLAAVADAISVLREDLVALDSIRELDPLRAALSQADKQLETAAAPKLAAALQARDIEATNVSRKVFGRAGRAGAFEQQYLDVRNKQIQELWVESIRSCLPNQSNLNDSDTEEDTAAAYSPQAVPPTGLGLTDPIASEVLSRFYERVHDMIRAESIWTQEALPDLKDGLLVQLVPHALKQLKPPLLMSTDSDRHHVGPRRPTPPEALHAVFQSAKLASKFASSLCETLVRDTEATHQQISAALTPVLLPVSFFLRNSVHFECQNAEYAITICLRDIESVDSKPTLSDCSNRIESATPILLNVADATISRCIEQSSGIAVQAAMAALKRCASTINYEVSGLIGRLRTGQDMRGSLKLLAAVAILARQWATKRETVIGESVSHAAPLLEKASGECASDESVMLDALLNASDSLHFGLLYILCKQPDLVTTALSAFNNEEAMSIQDSLGSKSELGSIVRMAQELVYESMFGGIREKLRLIPTLKEWVSKGDMDGVEEEDMADIPAFSNAPQHYAVEVGEHLMTIPQQLEPFVPDDIDAPLSSPPTPSFFGSATSPTQTVDDLYDSGGAHFARRWIAAIGYGTMDILVANIRRIPRLEKHGAVQLATDVEYISNVLGALGVSPSPEVALVRELLEVEVSELGAAAERLDSNEEQSLARQIAKMRISSQER